MVLLDSGGAVTTALAPGVPLTVQATLKDAAGAAMPNTVISFASDDATLGVVSIGETTLAVLEAARDLGGTSAVLFTDRRAIARGLTYLGMMVDVAPPEEAEVVLLPSAALMGTRLWTTVRAADVALRTALLEGEVVVVSHPLASLSPRNRADFRPASTLIDMMI